MTYSADQQSALPLTPDQLRKSVISYYCFSLEPWLNQMYLRAELLERQIKSSLSPCRSSDRMSLESNSNTPSTRLGSDGLGSPNLESWTPNAAPSSGLWGTSRGRYAGRYSRPYGAVWYIVCRSNIKHFRGRTVKGARQRLRRCVTGLGSSGRDCRSTTFLILSILPPIP